MSLIEIPDPPGYKVVAYRKPKHGEKFLESLDVISKADVDYEFSSRPILEPVYVWRDATIDDLKRAPCKARFKTSDGRWIVSNVYGFKVHADSSCSWISKDGGYFPECQVLEEPQG